MENKGNNIIELRNISKVFEDGHHAVDNVNLTVQRGEFVTFLGPSGCGKTTTLRMIAGFETPTEGEILLNGEEISKLPPYKRPVNTVFQRYALFPHLNIYNNIAFGLKIKKLPKGEIDRKVKKVLKMVDLEGFENRRIQTLSGGQQQRIAIARALVNEPEILLLDEPLGALDLKMRLEMQIELKKMHERLGITFIYVTHDQQEALTMSDKVVVMSNGKIQQIGTPEQIYDEPGTAFVADFIGESNIFSGVMTDNHKVKFCGAEFECVDDVEKGTFVDAVVRPEDIVISEAGAGDIHGIVKSKTFKGMYYTIAMESGKNEIIANTTKKVEIGTKLGLSIAPDAIHIIVAEDVVNRIETGLNKDCQLEFLDGKLICDVKSLLPGAVWNKQGVLTDVHGEQIDYRKLRVIVLIKPEDIEMSDNVDEGELRGHIVDLIYKVDHYSYLVRTEENEDFIVYDEDLWNIGDEVSLTIPNDKVSYSLKRA